MGIAGYKAAMYVCRLYFGCRVERGEETKEERNEEKVKRKASSESKWAVDEWTE